jgi:hypothetical protein
MDSLQVRQGDDVLESVIIQGDLSKLTPRQRVEYYQKVCESLGLNPLTQPFNYLLLKGKLVLYANKTASEQLRKINDISIEKPEIRFEDDWIIITVGAHDKNGRSDSDVGVVNKRDMQGDFGNALMKAVTKAKRRVTLSICGLGWADETEVETIPGAKPVIVDQEGEIKEVLPAVQVEVAKPGAHWSTDAQVRKTFWAWSTGQCVTNAEVHTILGVTHLSEYKGTEAEARQAVLDFITKHMAEIAKQAGE